MTGAAWLGAALALLVMFVIGVFTGMSAAHLGRIDCDDTPGRVDRAAAEERAEIWHAQAVQGAKAIGRLDQEIRAARLCRDQAEAERDELRGKLAQAEARLSDDRRARRLRARSCWCAECRAVADDDERAEVTS